MHPRDHRTGKERQGMQLKTYRAPTMAQALVEVKKDLGGDAVILHTRTLRVGGLLGLGGRQVVEITASGDDLKPASEITPKSPPAPAPRIKTTPQGTYTAGLAGVAGSTDSVRKAVEDAIRKTREHLDGNDTQPAPFVPDASPPLDRTPRPKPSPSPDSFVFTQPAAGYAEPKPAPRTSDHTPPHQPRPAPARQAVESELASLKRMVGQVLQTQRTGTPGTLTGPLFDLYTRMADNDVAPELADNLAGTVRDELTADELDDPQIVRETLLRHIEELIPTRHETPVARGQTGEPRVIALVGPTGVGKTTTVSKLAAAFKLRYHLRVGLITADTFRIAAVEQLGTYADIIELQMEVANTPGQMRLARERLAGCDVIVIDSTGRSHNDAERLAELRTFLDAARPDETHLVLPATNGERALARVAERFMALRPDRMLITKLDEAVTTGVLAGLPRRIGLPISYITTGQEVPDDIEPAHAPRLARMVLAGPAG